MDHEPVDSSMIDAVGYDPETRQMAVQFKGGKTYTYHDVDQSAHEAFVASDSIGKHFHQNVASAYRWTAG